MGWEDNMPSVDSFQDAATRREAELAEITRKIENERERLACLALEHMEPLIPALRRCGVPPARTMGPADRSHGFYGVPEYCYVRELPQEGWFLTGESGYDYPEGLAVGRSRNYWYRVIYATPVGAYRMCTNRNGRQSDIEISDREALSWMFCGGPEREGYLLDDAGEVCFTRSLGASSYEYSAEVVLIPVASGLRGTVEGLVREYAAGNRS